MKTLNQVLKHAKRKKYAIGHFNAATFEQMKAIVAAADATKTPVMIGTSEGEMKYLGAKRAVALLNEFRKETKVPIFLNADHAKSFEICKEAIDAGYDSVHLDGSHLPYVKNISLTKKVSAYAKKKRRGISVEGELGMMPTESSTVYHKKIKIDKSWFTDPTQAKDFVKKTGIDRLAAVFGTLHGISGSGVNPHIDLERLDEIDKATGAGVYLVMHGGSGTPVQDVKKAIHAGIVNVHISTEIRKLFVENLRRTLKREEYAPYKIYAPIVVKMQKFIEQKIKSFK